MPFVAIVVVGGIVIALGLRLTNHPASATPLPTPLSRAQFVRAADGVCLRAERQAKATAKAEHLKKQKRPTLKLLAKALRIAVPWNDEMRASLSRLDPPRADLATYRLLLTRLAEHGRGVRSMLHLVETGQIRSLTGAAHHVDVVERRQLPPLWRKLGLTACVKTTE